VVAEHLGGLAAARAARRIPSASSVHGRQAVEKAIKTLLALEQNDFEKTRDIGKLLALLSRTCRTVQDAMASALRLLTRFAVETRSPPPAASQEEAEEALKLAAGFLKWVRRNLPETV